MRDVMADPPWREEDLGQPLPDSPYAVSVSLPRWSHVIGYEEGDESVLAKLRTGYPRFLVPRVVRDLERAAASELGLREGRSCSIYPSEATARRCVNYIAARTDGWDVEVEEVFGGAARAVVFADEVAATAAEYWRYCGEGVSGRRAQGLMDGAGEAGDGRAAKAALRELIASHTGQTADEVFLFASGMAAVAAVQRALSARAPGLRTVQFDFPYVDVLRVQREFGSGVAFFPSADGTALNSLRGLVEGGEALAGIFCEVPSNPLLRSADLPQLHSITAGRGIPLVADDTVATNRNVDVMRFADLVTTSLTKYYSGAGDVLAGAVILNGDSPLAAELRPLLQAECCDSLWGGDAEVLLANAADYPERVARINETAPKLVEWLKSHPRVERVWYPTEETRAAFDAVRKDGGGYGGLFSILLQDAPRSSAPFYDALRVCKGPSLGTNFTLACPYTLLAHYGELDWCEEQGVSRWLIRISVGLENFEDLRGRFEAALAAKQ